MHVHSERLTVPPDQDLVVFLIGARANKWWQIPIVWGVSAAMGRMLRELRADPDAGLLSFEAYAGRTTLMVQYWRSLDHLHRYAHDRARAHVPAWRQWIQKWSGTGVMGIWHETFVLRPGTYESMYHHMPAFGLGRALPRVAAEGELKTAKGRLAVGRKALAHAEADPNAASAA